ncbi:hypothetical protein LCGC14_1319450 [marine sediment metagenome]|uniref:Uncharacterized protein n=1 Tax=marine sediment metagenome TaxID=412755 RepID=A0A0F9KKH3_9ZZZZ
MAILKAPLLSLGAAGQIAKSLVYFPWKGLNVVREYVVPSNPKTALQVTQRGYLAAAVQLIHDAQAQATNPLGSVDQVAYSALASAKGRIQTWFNAACKLYLDVIRAGDVPIVYRDATVSVTTPNPFTCIIYLEEETGSTLAAGKFYFGTSKTNLINVQAAVIVPGVSAGITAIDLSAFLIAGIKYFYQFRPDAADGCEGADSGIYNFYAT